MPILRAPRGAFSIPNKAMMKFRYSDQITVTCPANDSRGYFYFFRMNSLFDPNLTGAGHQPYYFDQLMPALYLSYMVYAVKVKANYIFSNNNVGSRVFTYLVPGKYDLSLSSDLPLNEWNAITERFEGTAFKLMSVENTRTTLKNFWKISKIKGKKLDQDDDAAIFGGNPTAVMQFGVGAGNVSGADALTNVNIYVRITYYAKLYNRAQPAQS